MTLEEIYGKLWRSSAWAEGQRRKIPNLPKPQPPSDIPQRISEMLMFRPWRTTDLGVAMGVKKTTLQNQLYTMRAAGEVHSVYVDNAVEWHLGPEQVAA